MPVMTEKRRSCFVDLFERVEKGLLATAAWFHPVRKSAIARFGATGLPTTQDEEWRYTNVSALEMTAFAPAVPLERPLPAEETAPYLFGDPGGARLVFVNGYYDERLSSVPVLPGNVRPASLAAAMRSDADALRPHLARHAQIERNPFTALNTALFPDGAFVHVPRGVVVERPIQVLYLSTGGGEPTVSHPRTLIVAGEAAQVSVVETFAGLSDGASLTNAVTEIVAGDGAIVDHYQIQREPDAAWHVGLVRSHQGRSATVTSHAITLGGGLIRNDVHAVLDGEGGELDLNGLYVGRGRRHIDSHLRVEHARPHCNSREYYKGILEDASHGVFTGRILVHKDAQKTDAKQTNMNLLLSPDAQVDTKPQLEIFADDVKCTHGATIGQIEESELFYLRSRGISRDDAKRLLIYAFASESLSRVKVAPLRESLEALLFGGAAERRRFQEAQTP
ncbi:MAG: Fe-S cluster assembly protein SufD [Phycisphaerae bacterium]